MSNKTQIIIIDEDKDFVDAISERLKACGFLSAGITNGAQLFQLLSKFKPDLLIFSSKLKNPTWIEIIERVKNSSVINHEIPIIATCYEVSPGLIQLVKVHGLKKILKKPIIFQDFLKTINEITASPEKPEDRSQKTDDR